MHAELAEWLGAPWLMQSSSQLPTPRLLPPSVPEVVTFVRWCGPVEPFPDAGRFDEPRGGGSPVTRGQREACEPFEGGRGHARFAEPAAQFQRFVVPGLGCGGVAVGFVAPPQASQRDPFEDRGAEVDEPVHRDRVVPPGLVPVAPSTWARRPYPYPASTSPAPSPISRDAAAASSNSRLAVSWSPRCTFSIARSASAHWAVFHNPAPRATSIASSRARAPSSNRPNCRSPHPRWYRVADSPQESSSCRNAAAVVRPSADRGVDVAGLDRGLHPDEPDDRGPPRVTVAVELFLRSCQQRLRPLRFRAGDPFDREEDPGQGRVPGVAELLEQGQAFRRGFGAPGVGVDQAAAGPFDDGDRLQRQRPRRR